MSKRVQVIVTMEVEDDAEPSVLASAVDDILREHNNEVGIHQWVDGIDRCEGRNV